MLQDNPENRITLESISKHPWVNDQDLPNYDELN
jgi:hypothetical protein